MTNSVVVESCNYLLRLDIKIYLEKPAFHVVHHVTQTIAPDFRNALTLFCTIGTPSLAFYYSVLSTTPSTPRSDKRNSINLYTKSPLTNDQSSIFWEIIFWNFEVQRSRAFSYTARNIVMGTVTRAEPSSEVTGFADGHTTQMCANT